MLGRKKEAALFNAVVEGSIAKVKKLVEKGITPKQLAHHDKAGYNALTQAAVLNQYVIIQELVKAGIDPNIKDNLGRTALFVAATCHRKEVAQVLVESDTIDLLLKCLDGKNAMEIAIEQKAGDVVAAIGGALGKKLIKAAENKDRAKVRELLEIPGLNVNQQDITGCTALHYAMRHNIESMVDLLAAKGADATIKNRAGRTPIDNAMYYGNELMVKRWETLYGTKGADSRKEYDEMTESHDSGDPVLIVSPNVQKEFLKNKGHTATTSSPLLVRPWTQKIPDEMLEALNQLNQGDGVFPSSSSSSSSSGGTVRALPVSSSTSAISRGPGDRVRSSTVTPSRMAGISGGASTSSISSAGSSAAGPFIPPKPSRSSIISQPETFSDPSSSSSSSTSSGDQSSGSSAGPGPIPKRPALAPRTGPAPAPSPSSSDGGSAPPPMLIRPKSTIGVVSAGSHPAPTPISRPTPAPTPTPTPTPAAPAVPVPVSRPAPAPAAPTPVSRPVRPPVTMVKAQETNGVEHPVNGHVSHPEQSQVQTQTQDQTQDQDQDQQLPQPQPVSKPIGRVAPASNGRVAPASNGRVAPVGRRNTASPGSLNPISKPTATASPAPSAPSHSPAGSSPALKTAVAAPVQVVSQTQEDNGALPVVHSTTRGGVVRPASERSTPGPKFVRPVRPPPSLPAEEPDTVQVISVSSLSSLMSIPSPARPPPSLPSR